MSILTKCSDKLGYLIEVKKPLSVIKNLIDLSFATLQRGAMENTLPGSLAEKIIIELNTLHDVKDES